MLTQERSYGERSLAAIIDNLIIAIRIQMNRAETIAVREDLQAALRLATSARELNRRERQREASVRYDAAFRFVHAIGRPEAKRLRCEVVQNLLAETA